MHDHVKEIELICYRIRFYYFFSLITSLDRKLFVPIKVLHLQTTGNSIHCAKPYSVE